MFTHPFRWEVAVPGFFLLLRKSEVVRDTQYITGIIDFLIKIDDYLHIMMVIVEEVCC